MSTEIKTFIPRKSRRGAHSLDRLVRALRDVAAHLVFKNANAGLLFFIIDSFDLLFGTATPYMRAFLAHFFIELAEKDPKPKWQKAAFYHLPNGFSLADFSGLERKACFAKLAKAFAVE